MRLFSISNDVKISILINSLKVKRVRSLVRKLELPKFGVTGTGFEEDRSGWDKKKRPIDRQNVT